MNKDLLALISLFVVIFIIWIFALYMPQTSKMHSLNEKIQEYQEMEKRHVPHSMLILMERRLDSLKAEVMEIKDHYYQDKAILDLGRHIEKIGNEYGLEFQNIALLDYEMLNFFGRGNEKRVTELPVKIEFLGQYDELKNFLDNIDDFPFLIRFTEVLIFNDIFQTKKLNIVLNGKVVMTKSEENETRDVVNENI